MASMNTRLNIKNLDENIVQKHEGSKQAGLKQLGSKQVGFKQLGHKQVGFKQIGRGVETGFHKVQDEKRVWFEVELQGAQGGREAKRRQTRTACKGAEKGTPWYKGGGNITVTGVPGQEGAEGNVAKKKKVKESMKANLKKLLKYNAWLTRRSPVRGSSIG
uniref:Zinc finger, CCHC-type n=1 Tax=Tanacetum cinerariifolium TaxID=118510 RepID=A0A6L2NL00_TANCI|nr:zinc finger, CCHC-type [Tanacetum cinerariifolium]